MTAAPIGRPDPPVDAELAGILGPAFEPWNVLRQRIRSVREGVTERWVYGGRKYGWSYRLEHGKKGILYLTPDSGHFRVGVALSDAGREAVLASDLPSAMRERLAGETRAIEGWPVRMRVWTADDVGVAQRLAEIKLST
jgi:hypothetical protein